MQIRELRLNIQFDYIRDIRKYLYDIETMLREKKLCDILNIVPQIPDDIEPQIERLSTTKSEDNKDTLIFISQASLSILFVYKTSLRFEDIFNKEVEYISDITKKIKEFIKSLNPIFKINYEGLVVASSKIVLNNDEILINSLNINLDTEENRTKVVKKIDNKHFLAIEKSILRNYNPKPNTNPMAVKYDFDSSIGWVYIVLIEIHNRQEFNISKDDKKDLELDLNFAKTKIEKYFKEEAI